MKTTKLLASILVIVGVLALLSASNAGSLEPSNPPGSTMKTLNEVEPRKPVSSVPYIITESGSYYLSANAQTTSSLFSGITIWADNVTLDLMGFSLIGDGTSGLHGISIEGTHKNITIRNGTITNWGGNGIEAPDTNSCRVEDLQVIDNKRSGIHLPGDKQVVTNCVASDNGASATSEVYGIYVGNGSSVTGNTTNGNGDTAGNNVYGIYASTGCTVTGNTASNNGHLAAGSNVYGILAHNGSTVTGNTAGYNGDSAGSANGILVFQGCTVTGNTASNNGHSANSNACGIFAFQGSIVTDNTACYNGDSAGSNAYGIKTEMGCRVAGNTAYSNGTSAGGEVSGIYAGAGCTLTSNTVHQNGGGAQGYVSGIYANDYCTLIGNTAYFNSGVGIVALNYCLIDQNNSNDNGDSNWIVGTGCQEGLNGP